jgi:hypothetical protein
VVENNLEGKLVDFCYISYNPYEDGPVILIQVQEDEVSFQAQGPSMLAIARVLNKTSHEVTAAALKESE